MINKKVFLLFLGIKNYRYTTKLAKRVDMTFASVALNIKNWKRTGLIKTKKTGRTKYLTYTKKGKEVRKKLLPLEKELGLLCKEKEEMPHGRDY